MIKSITVTTSDGFYKHVRITNVDRLHTFIDHECGSSMYIYYIKETFPTTICFKDEQDIGIVRELINKLNVLKKDIVVTCDEEENE